MRPHYNLLRMSKEQLLLQISQPRGSSFLPAGEELTARLTSPGFEFPDSQAPTTQDARPCHQFLFHSVGAGSPTAIFLQNFLPCYPKPLFLCEETLQQPQHFPRKLCCSLPSPERWLYHEEATTLQFFGGRSTSSLWLGSSSSMFLGSVSTFRSSHFLPHENSLL